jgi:glucose/arabinose dehydrogenase
MRRRHDRSIWGAIIVVLVVVFVAPPPAGAAAPPSGFTATAVTGITDPTALTIAPDGRVFVAQQGGALRVIKGGGLLAQPFIQFTVDSSGERGLLGVALDPAFRTNGFVYVYYTATTPTVHNRVSRITAAGDVAALGSEVVLVNLPTLDFTNHNGGAIHFGPDGKLYVGVGENAHSERAAQLTNPFGKILRLNADGSFPTDNPFYDGNGPNWDGIWAYGFRNPFTFAFSGNRLLANDVGQETWEEVDVVRSGRNYGWPTREGPCVTGSTTNCGPPPGGLVNPIFSYKHGEGCAITGAAFYNPPRRAAFKFPAAYLGDYFFADLCGGWMRTLQKPNYNSATPFLSPDAAVVPTDIAVAPDGSLWYTSRGAGTAVRIRYQP